MPDNQAVVEFLAKVAGTSDVEALNNAMKKADTTAKQHNDSVKRGAGEQTAAMKKADTTAKQHNDSVKRGAGEQTAALGMTRREWMRTGSEASFYLTSIASKSGEAGKALGEATGMVTQLGESFMFGGGVGVAIAGIGIGVSLLSKALFEVSPEIKELDDQLKSIAEKDKTAQTLAQISGATTEQAKQALIAAGASKQFADELLRLEQAATKTKGQQFLEWAMPLVDQFNQLNPVVRLGTQLGKEWSSSAEGMTDAQNDLRDALENSAPKVLEHNRQLEFYKSNLKGASSEVTSYKEKLNDLSTAHQKAIRGFAEDEAKVAQTYGKAIRDAVGRANETIEKAHQDSAERIIEINSSMLERIGDLQGDHLENETDRYRDYARSIQDLNEDIAKDAREQARELQNLNADYLEKEMGAKSWSEVQQIRREQARRRDELGTKQREQNDELDKRKRRLDEDYRYNAAREDKKLAEAIAREQQQSQKQIVETRKRERDQIESAQRTAGEQITTAREREQAESAAISKRRNEENTAYAENKAKATETHNQRMNELLTYRNETESFNAYLSNLAAAGYTIPVRYQNDLSGTQDFQSGYRPQGWYAGGLDAVVRRPTIIGVGEKGAERVTVTPLTGGNATKSGMAQRPINFYNCNFRDVSDVYVALERYERGLN